MPKRLPNIVIFAIDSIRRDHMSCYGYGRVTTPHLDRMAAAGARFENAFSAYIPTTPAYSSILTGKDVISHQQPSLRPNCPIPDEFPTLPEFLEKAGYNTTCIGFGAGLYRGFGKHLNFEGWCSYEERPARKAENLNAVALPELDRLSRSKKPFLLFLRHLDPHAPYLPPAPYDTMFYSKNPCDRKNKSMKPVFAFKPFADFLKSWMPPGCTDKDYVIAQYDGELAYMDACIECLVARMEALGILEDTLIVVTGDHGETLYDHECFFDHHGLYEPTLTVPLIYYWPGRVPAGVRSSAHTLHEDLMPTVIDLCGLKRFAKGLRFDGKSLRGCFTDPEKTPRSEFYISECTWMRKQGWRTPIWKFWEALEPDFHNKPPVELYNLLEDPEESVNLASKERQVVEMLRHRMQAWIHRRERQTGKKSNIENYHLGTDLHIGAISQAKKKKKGR